MLNEVFKEVLKRNEVHHHAAVRLAHAYDGAIAKRVSSKSRLDSKHNLAAFELIKLFRRNTTSSHLEQQKIAQYVTFLTTIFECIMAIFLCIHR